jgi:UDP-glucose-4-epimerase GalE
MIMIVGGAGYIGSSVAYYLHRQGKKAVVVDNLSTGFEILAKNSGCPFIFCDVKERESIFSVMKEVKPDVIMYFAASQGVPESVENPSLFYRNNVSGAINILDAMLNEGINCFIFSSTAASYGIPQHIPISENHPISPTTPYGWSKIMVERILEDYRIAYGTKFAALRYFNAAGHIPNAPVGEMHDPEAHLIPNILLSIFRKESRTFEIYGDNYPTPDGTCIRDYIHVEDLARAHILAAEYLMEGGESNIMNLGTGIGNSVMEVLDACKRVTGKDIPYVIKEPRKGDPPVLVASYEKANKILGWAPRWESIDEIVFSAWDWHRTQEKQDGWNDGVVE